MQTLNIIHPEVERQAEIYRRQFDSAKPFRHVVIDNFLQPELAESLLRDFPSVSDPSKLVNEFGDPNPKSQVSDVRGLGGTYELMDRAIQSEGFLRLMSRITGIPDLKYDPYYFGAGTHENFHGAGLDPHYDFNIHPVTSQWRRLNAIVYLNKEWDPNWGGSICFHSDPWDLKNDEVKAVQPLFNRCAIFETTERSWHSVPPVSLPPDRRGMSRKSFTIYLYSEDRPKEERAPSHGTVYVQVGLPPHIKAGHTLSEEDEGLIYSNLTKRNYYLKALYKREYKFSEQFDRLKTHINELRARSYFPVIGYAKIERTPAPLYHDGFMGRHAEVEISALKPVKELRLFGYRPDSIGASIELELRAAAMVSKKRIGIGSFEISLRLEPAQSGPITIALTTDNAARPVNSQDERELSCLVDRIELVH